MKLEVAKNMSKQLCCRGPTEWMTDHAVVVTHRPCHSTSSLGLEFAIRCRMAFLLADITPKVSESLETYFMCKNCSEWWWSTTKFIVNQAFKILCVNDFVWLWYHFGTWCLTPTGLSSNKFLPPVPVVCSQCGATSAEPQRWAAVSRWKKLCCLGEPFSKLHEVEWFSNV